MDSLTQIVLGASVAAAIVPAAHRRAALAAGAVLGTLPDLDGIPIALMTDDPVLRMTMHRGLTHSLLVLPLIAAAIWWLFKRFGKGVPVIGGVVGAGLDGWILHKIADKARADFVPTGGQITA